MTEFIITKSIYIYKTTFKDQFTFRQIVREAIPLSSELLSLSFACVRVRSNWSQCSTERHSVPVSRAGSQHTLLRVFIHYIKMVVCSSWTG